MFAEEFAHAGPLVDGFRLWAILPLILISLNRCHRQLFHQGLVSSCFLKKTRIGGQLLKGFRSGFLSKRTKQGNFFRSRAGIRKSPRAFGDPNATHSALPKPVSND